MPMTVSQAFASASLAPEGVVRWGQPVPERATGIYVVSVARATDSTAEAVPEAPLELARLKELRAVRPETSLDGRVTTAAALQSRLETFWFHDEVILYVGLAGQPLRTRVRQYYTTPLGARKPHAGGWWLKTLSVLEDLWVHYAPTPDSKTTERTMLKAFADQVPAAARAGLHDPDRVAPFANLRCWDNAVKRHGIMKATGDTA
jgi:hypothetical protein